MIEAERREAARQFIYKWSGKGNEDQDSQKYWFDFLSYIVGIDNITDRVDFEKKVVVDGHTKKIDVYIPETHTLIEQKSYGKALDKKIINSGDISLTPYEQAKRYNDNLPYDEKARWIVTSNFSEIWIYDMNTAVPSPVKIQLDELQTKFSLFDFMIDKEQEKLSLEMEVSVKAGEFVGLIYDSLLKQYIDPTSKFSQKSLNMLCVRLVFCLYAEDAHIFGNNGHMFHDYMNHFETKDLRKALMELFKILDTPEDKRDPYDKSLLSQFPYVNGGLFADEDIEIPNFTDEIRNVLLNRASDEFDWSMISPTIFGAVFESTLNPETRRSGGMHYTSIENIHKVIDPLFLDELKNELEEIKKISVIKTRDNKLREYQKKISTLTWLDPACGSGNFLTETYLSIRKLENEIIKILKGGQISFLDASNPIMVSINQFYGIEINDFAVTVAKTALWIAESQMMKQTEDILLMHLDFLPLKTNAHIIEANALRIDWETVVPRNVLSFIMGNPPFVGQAFRTKVQSEDMQITFGKGQLENKQDYVICWFKKAVDYIRKPGNNKIKVAFVATNSICQGESVPTFWKNMIDMGTVILFGYRTFVWGSEANDKAHVHCVIVGFSNVKFPDNKYIYQDGQKILASHINPYLMDAPDIWLTNRINVNNYNLPKMTTGNPPTDDGGLLLTITEKEYFEKKYPQLKKYIRPFIGSREFLHDKVGSFSRYCFWFVDSNPADYSTIPEIRERLERVKNLREKSTADRIRKMAPFPYLFCQIRQPDTNYLIIPETSSERRRYIPMGFIKPEVICSNAVKFIPNSSLYIFGILTSNVHMAWTRVVCGRMKSDYRYSPAIYNNFPWPSINDEQRKIIEKTAQGILDARLLYKDNCLADIYDPLTMPVELRKAHTANDIAVMNAYGFDIKKMSEDDCVAELMKMYVNSIKE